MAFWFMGLDSVQRSKDYIKNGDPNNPDLANDVATYARTAFYVYQLGRFVLLICSIKRMRVTKYYIYYEVVQRIIEQFLPKESTFGDVFWALLTQ